MKKWESTWLRRFACVAFAIASATTPLPAATQENVREIGAVIAPPNLVAAYSCTTYAEAVFLPKVRGRMMPMLQNASDKQATVRRLLLEYDAVLESMCRETAGLFERHREKVLNVYARQLPGVGDDIKPFLANPEAKRWASENAAFLVTTAPLVQYYGLIKAAAPELVEVPVSRLDQATELEVKATSVGMTAQHERALLIVMLADGGFAKVAPERFDLTSLKEDELRLRKEAARLKHATPFPWFNNNASDLVRMHFNGFDVMREFGLAEIYLKYDQLMGKVPRGN